MDNSQRGSSNDSSTTPSVSVRTMPTVLFREIHKNAFLKRHSSDRRTGFPRKSEKVWVVFCVHDDIEPFLEIYPDQKVALTHKPEWFASLSTALHVSPTICGHEDEFEFAVTLSFQVVRLAAPSWDSMMEWVETIRNKLRELKVLCPKENIYSKMPEPKMPLLPTRDPNSPLPLPPEGPSTLLPGVELVHLETRNIIPPEENGDIRRSQRDVNGRNNAAQERQINKRRVNQREHKRPGAEGSQIDEVLTSVNTSNSQTVHIDEQSAGPASLNLTSETSKNKPRVRRAASVPQAVPSSSNSSVGSNITVIEVVASNSRENHSASESRSDIHIENSDSEEIDDVFVTSTKNIISGETDANEEEGYYEHVFPSAVIVNKPQLVQTFENVPTTSINMNQNNSKKSHSTSLVISATTSAFISSSPHENSAVSCSATSPVNLNHKELPSGTSTDISRNLHLNGIEKSDLNVTRVPVEPSSEKISIPVIIPRLPAKSVKHGVFKSTSLAVRDSDLNVNDNKKNFKETGSSSTQESAILGVKGDGGIRKEENGENSNGGLPPYSQVKKISKVKVKTEDSRNEQQSTSHNGSPIFLKRKVSEIQIVEAEPQCSQKPESLSNICVNKNQICKPGRPSQNVVVCKKKEDSRNLNLDKDMLRNVDRNHSVSNPSSKECKNEVLPNSVPSTSGTRVDNSRINVSKKDLLSCCNNNTEVEPITATVQPTVGVISVEDIPLIGGHQRRRRRSSSSEAAPTANTSSSRGLGGADRIRINVPLTSNVTPRNDCETRPSGLTRNGTDQIVHVTPQSSRLTLREQQVLQLKKEILHPSGVRLQLRRKDCLGSIALVDALNGVW